MTDYSVKRDQWGRVWVTNDGGPLIIPEGRKTPTNAVAYSRVSTMAGVLDDKANLAPWQAAQSMIGMLKKPSIQTVVSSLVAKTPDNTWAEHKKQLKELVASAQDAAQSDDGSNRGTAFHQFTEVIDEGRELQHVPREFEPWIEAYVRMMERFEVLASEKTVVVDELKLCGTFDKLVRDKLTGKVHIYDLKTGASDPAFPLKALVQFASYSRGVYYDQATGERTPIHPDLDLDVAIMAHVPIRSSGKPSATAYAVDIRQGWEYAKLAVQVYNARKTKKLEPLAG